MKNVTPGAWLTASVYMLRTRQISSASDADVRQHLAEPRPHWPYCLNGLIGGEQAGHLPAPRHGREPGRPRTGLGNVLPAHLRISRLVVEQVDMRGRTALPEDDDAFGLRGEVRQARQRARWPLRRATARAKRILLQQAARATPMPGAAAEKLAAGHAQVAFKVTGSFAGQGFVQVQNRQANGWRGGMLCQVDARIARSFALREKSLAPRPGSALNCVGGAIQAAAQDAASSPRLRSARTTTRGRRRRIARRRIDSVLDHVIWASARAASTQVTSLSVVSACSGVLVVAELHRARSAGCEASNMSAGADGPPPERVQASAVQVGARATADT